MSLEMLEREVLGNQTGAAYVKIGWMRDLYVGLEHRLLLVSPGGSSKGFEDVEVGGGTGCNGGDVGGEISFN